MTERFQQTFHWWTSAQGIKGQEKGEAEGKAAEDQNIFCPGVIRFTPRPKSRFSSKPLALARGPMSRKAATLLRRRGSGKPAHRDPRTLCRVHANLFDTFVRVIHVSAAATFETVGPWVALRSGFNRLFHRFGVFDRLDGLLFVAHRCDAGPVDSIDDNSGGECQTEPVYGDSMFAPPATTPFWGFC